MAKRRVNTKFLAILIAVMVLLSGAVVGVVILRKSKSVGQLEEMAQLRLDRVAQINAELDEAIRSSAEPVEDPIARLEAMHAAEEQKLDRLRSLSGNLRGAAGLLDRAYRKSKDPEYLRRQIEIMAKMPVDNRPDANNMIAGIRSSARTYADTDPLAYDRHAFYYEWLLNTAQRLNAIALYDLIYTDAASRLEANPENHIAQKYRAIARTRVLRDDMTLDQRQEPLQDIEQLLALAEFQGDADLHLAQAMWWIREAQRLDRAQQLPERVLELKTKAHNATRHAVSLAPEDSDLLISALPLALVRGMEAADLAAELVTSIHALAQARPEDKRLVTTAIAALYALEQLNRRFAIQGDSLDGVVLTTQQLEETKQNLVATAEQAVLLTEASLMHHPRDARLLMLHSDSLQRMGRQEDAVRVLELATRDQPIDLPGDFLAREQAGMQALYRFGERQIKAALQSQSPEDRQARLKSAEASADRLQEIEPGTQFTNALRGQLAYHRQEYQRAAQLLSSATQQFNHTNIELEMQAADAMTRIGQRTAAIIGYERVLGMMLNSSSMSQQMVLRQRMQLVDLYLSQREMARARGHLNETLEVLASSDDGLLEPENAISLRLLEARVLGMEGQEDEALAMLQQVAVEPDLQRRQLVSLAGLYEELDQPQAATLVLQRAAEQFPGDPQILRQLVTRVEPEEREALMQRARDAGANPSTVALLDRVGDKPMTVADLGQVLESRAKEDASARIQLASLYHRSGKTAERDAVIEEVLADDPDNASMIRLAFAVALQDQRFEDAQALSERAEALDLDLAKGAFFRARLAAARDEIVEAITHYQQGLNINAVDARHWVGLAELYVRQGDLDPAVDAYRQALNLNQRLMPAIQGLAQAYSLQQEHTLAIQTLERALVYSPENDRLREMILQYRNRFGDKRQTLLARQQLAASDPENFDNRRSLALALAEGQQAAEAVRVIDAVIEEDGSTLANVRVKAAVYAAANDNDRAVSTLSDWLHAQDQPEVDDILLVAQFQMELNAFEQARVTLDTHQGQESQDQRRISRLRATVLSRLGLDTLAVEQYQELIDAFPEEDRIRLALVQLYLSRGNLDLAQNALVPITPSPERALMAIQLLRMQQQPEAATQVLQEAVAQWPDHPGLLGARAVMTVQSGGDHASALADLDQGLTAATGNQRLEFLRLRAQLLQRLDRGREAEEVLVSLVERNPRDDASRRLLVGMLQSRGDTTSALSMAEQALQTNPKSVLWLQASSELALALGDRSRSIAYGMQALKEEASPALLHRTTNLLLEDNRSAQALSLLQEHDELVQESAVLLSDRAWALAEQGRRTRAREVMSQSLAKVNRNQGQAFQMVLASGYRAVGGDVLLRVLENPDLEIPAPVLIVASIEVAEEEFSSAIGRLEPALSSIEPSRQRQALFLLASAYHQDNRFEDALRAYEVLLKNEPDSPALNNNVAYLLVDKLGQAEKAKAFSERAVKGAPDNPAVLDTLGLIQMRMGEFDRARQTLEHALKQAEAKRDPTLLNVLAHLGEVKMKQGESLESEVLLNRALKMAQSRGDIEIEARINDLLNRIGTP